MLLAEYDYDTDIAVQRAEEREIAFEQGIERGRSVGFADGLEQGINRGAYQTKLETAKILKQLGDPLQKIIQATGLSREEIEKL